MSTCTGADVKNRRSKSAKGSKVTGLAFQPLAGNQHAGSSEGVHSTVASSLLLVTSADARLRLFDGYGLVCKLKGPSLGCAATIKTCPLHAAAQPRVS